jgi:hypothetical protein
VGRKGGRRLVGYVLGAECRTQTANKQSIDAEEYYCLLFASQTRRG